MKQIMILVNGLPVGRILHERDYTNIEIPHDFTTGEAQVKMVGLMHFDFQEFVMLFEYSDITGKGGHYLLRSMKLPYDSKEAIPVHECELWGGGYKAFAKMVLELTELT
jgi:hypothetical protein